MQVAIHSVFVRVGCLWTADDVCGALALLSFASHATCDGALKTIRRPWMQEVTPQTLLYVSWWAWPLRDAVFNHSSWGSLCWGIFLPAVLVKFGVDNFHESALCVQLCAWVCSFLNTVIHMQALCFSVCMNIWSFCLHTLKMDSAWQSMNFYYRTNDYSSYIIHWL